MPDNEPFGSRPEPLHLIDASPPKPVQCGVGPRSGRARADQDTATSVQSESER